MLIIEDGSNVTDSNCYISLADAEAYYLDYMGSAWDAASSDDFKDSAILRAARYLDALRWKGIRANGRSQSMAWPRAGVADCDGTIITTDVVPIEVVRANALFAFYELTAPSGLDPNVTLSTLAKREKVDVIEVEYRDTPTNAQSVRPIITGAMDQIKCLVRSGNTEFLKRA